MSDLAMLQATEERLNKLVERAEIAAIKAEVAAGLRPATDVKVERQTYKPLAQSE